MHENVADIIAWLAIIAASAAITNTGQKRLPVSHKAQISHNLTSVNDMKTESH
jgi:hypothetical protein